MLWLHRYIKLVALSTLLLIAAGGMVTSTDSGLAVPDWPNTYGQFMFAFPLERMVGGIFYEHGHRMIASTVGFLTIILAVWVWIVEPRRWLRWMGAIALAAVIIQGILGGITVLYLLPAPVSVGHAGLAQIFFCMTAWRSLTFRLRSATSFHPPGTWAWQSILLIAWARFS
jgi:cytochrome c oxidase assembly protein subunit 15